MTVKGTEQKSLKKVVAGRAEELGDHVSPREVTIEFMEAPPAPGCRVFHARWGAGEAQKSLSGLIRDKEAPDTYPAKALEKIFQRWIETDGALPNARLAATVAAFLYDPSSRHNMVLSDEDKIEFIRRQEWLPHIGLPELIEVAGQPGITFWWVGERGASQMRVYLAEESTIRTEETFIQDFLNADGSVS